MISPKAGLWLGTIAIFCRTLAGAFQAFEDRPPTMARASPVTDTYFGHSIVDPYRWMEDTNSPELLTWMAKQDEEARSYLHGLRCHEDFQKREREVQTETTGIDRVRRQAEEYAYVKKTFANHTSALYVRDGLTGPEKLLASTSPSENHQIEEFDLSRDGRYVAYVTSSQGREVGELRVVETNTGKLLPDVIKETRMVEPFMPDVTCFTGTWWAPDNRSFVYRRLGRDGSLKDSTVLLHTIGTERAKDLVLFGSESTRMAAAGSGIPFVWFAKDSPNLIAQIGASVEPNKQFFIAPISALRQQPLVWRRISSLDDEVRDISTHGDDVFLRTSKGAPRFEILRLKATAPDIARAQRIFPGGDAVLERSVPAKDGLYVQALEGGTRKVYRIEYGSWVRQTLPIPAASSAKIIANDPAEPGVLLYVESWTEPPSVVAWTPEQKRITPTQWLPASSVRLPDVKIENVLVPSHDGVRIPLVIISPRNRAPDRPARTAMFGYGASGMEWTAPFFASGAIPWYERGGIEAFVGARGGGEYGEEWQRAGTGANKPNTWKDFIACAEYMVRNGYTTREQLGAVAVSAGGILAGNSLVERPDLFAAVAISAGLMNPLRLSLTPFGKGHPEFGRIGTEEEFKATAAMDPYEKIREGVKYPAVLLIHGINDPRVPPYFSAKFAARLQAASTSGKPVLLKVMPGAGHDVFSPENLADEFAFLFENLTPVHERSSK